MFVESDVNEPYRVYALSNKNSVALFIRRLHP